MTWRTFLPVYAGVHVARLILWDLCEGVDPRARWMHLARRGMDRLLS